MTIWTRDELNKIGNAEELQIASSAKMAPFESRSSFGSLASATISTSDRSTGATLRGSVVFKLVMKDTSVLVV